jgi:hypothetical protein
MSEQGAAAVPSGEQPMGGLAGSIGPVQSLGAASKGAASKGAASTALSAAPESGMVAASSRASVAVASVDSPTTVFPPQPKRSKGTRSLYIRRW